MYRSLYPTNQQMRELYGLNENGDNSDDDASDIMIKQQASKNFKANNLQAQAKSLVQSQQAKREQLKKSLIPNSDPDQFNAMMTGAFIPQNLKANLLQNTPINVTMQRTNHI